MHIQAGEQAALLRPKLNTAPPMTNKLSAQPPARLAAIRMMAQLPRLYDHDIDAVMVRPERRAVPSSAIAAASPEKLASVQHTGSLSELRDALEAVIKTKPAWMVEDILSMAAALNRFFETAQLKLRLEPIIDDACRKFHVDNVVCRMICTYSGPATQFVNNTASCDAEIWQAPTGAACILKGKKWPQSASVSLAHRSPPIVDTGQSRLLVVLEPVFEVTAFRKLAQSVAEHARQIPCK